MKIQAILDDKGDEVQTIRPDVDATIATALMKTNRIATLVVIDDDKVVGLVGEREIVHAVVDGAGSIVGSKVRDIMDRHPVSCRARDHIDDVMKIMTQNRRRHVPVVDDGQLCGIVSIGDMVKFRLEEMEYESRVLRDAYITNR